jgi:hypothetical protein
MHLGKYNAPGMGIKHDQGKPQWNLLPLKYLVGVVRVLMFGAKKYDAWNWRKGMPWSQPYNALMRHLIAWSEGEETDPETGESHLDHAMCCLIFLRFNTMEKPDLDDRYKP